MINISMSWWELALMIVAVAIIFGTVYLNRLLRKLTETISDADRMISENRKEIDGIITNVDKITTGASEITEKANVMTTDVQESVVQVKTEVIEPVVTTLKKFSKILGVLTKKK